MPGPDSLASLIAAADRHGLVLRGGFAVAAHDQVPDVGGAPARHLLLFGNAGSSMWEAFSKSAEYRDRRPDPLNRWSRRIGQSLAGQWRARALFPFGGPPHLPFLRWGKKAEALQNSQLGMLMHPRFGLWHAYRFALALAQPIDLPAPAADPDICLRCRPKPCLRACPVNAFSATGYEVQSCFRHLAEHPGGRCMTDGCQARLACPQGAGYRYRPPHAAFHMGAFVVAMEAGEFAAKKGENQGGRAPK